MIRTILSVLILIGTVGPAVAQEQTATEIVTQADRKLRGDHSSAQIKMTVVRPDWSREIGIRFWSKGDDRSLIMIDSPAREKGTGFLKRENEMWNWQPSIDRVIKLPPSMMTQSWMGSDFTNDDLAKESSTVHDYTHDLIDEESIDGRQCWKIELTPKEDAAVVWGKIILWIDQKDHVQMKAEYYDEDDYLVNTMHAKAIKELGGRMLPSILEMIPADEEGHKTVIEYISLEFETDHPDGFFSLQNMKRIK